MKHTPKNVLTRILIGVLIGCLFLYVIFSCMDLFGVFRKPITLESWPSYDEAFRMDTGSVLPAEEDLAYFVATKIPDQGKDGLIGIYIEKRYNALELTAGPNYIDGNHPVYYEPPYSGSIVIAEGTAFEIALKYESGVSGCSAYNLQKLLNENSDCFFACVVISRPGHPDSSSIDGHYVPVKSYQTYHSDYTAQP